MPMMEKVWFSHLLWSFVCFSICSWLTWEGCIQASASPLHVSLGCCLLSLGLCVLHQSVVWCNSWYFRVEDERSLAHMCIYCHVISEKWEYSYFWEELSPWAASWVKWCFILKAQCCFLPQYAVITPGSFVFLLFLSNTFHRVDIFERCWLVLYFCHEVIVHSYCEQFLHWKK